MSLPVHVIDAMIHTCVEDMPGRKRPPSSHAASDGDGSSDEDLLTEQALLQEQLDKIKFKLAAKKQKPTPSPATQLPAAPVKLEANIPEATTKPRPSPSQAPRSVKACVEKPVLPSRAVEAPLRTGGVKPSTSQASFPPTDLEGTEASSDETDGAESLLGNEATHSGKYGVVHCPKTGKEFWLNYAGV